MKTKLLLRLVVAFAVANATPGWLYADQAEEESAIRESVAAYVVAFNQGNAQAIAAQWSPDAVYSNPMTGEEVTGRKAIEEQLVEIFKIAKKTKIEVDINSILFLSPSVAVEEGTARLLRPGEEPDATVYSCLHVKSGGKWLVDRMTEQSEPVFRSNYQHLKDLQWMIGTWVDQDGSAIIETTSQWSKNQNFITRRFSVSFDGESDLSGVQLIGWDPVAQNIRSWVFDSDGGFGGSTWKKTENKWVINSSATLSDGRKASAVKTLTVIDDKTITWQASGRSIDGEILPNIDPIKLTRNLDSE
ncbi:MAG: SgcJ/EcaC family oxidoreductase [Pirellulales bacterium]